MIGMLLPSLLSIMNMVCVVENNTTKIAACCLFLRFLLSE